MSLHGKIIAWFVVFASLTVLLFGLGDYYQSTHALRFALEARASSLARRMAGEVDRQYEGAERELLALGYAVAGAAPDSRLISPTRFTVVRVLRDGSLLREFSGTPGVIPRGCGTDDVHFDVMLPERGGREVRVVAVMPVNRFFADIPTASARLGERGIVTVLRPDGTMVFDAGCNASSDREPALLGAALASHVRVRTPAEPDRVVIADLSQSGEQLDDDRFLAIARSANPAWAIVIGVDYAQFAAPFLEARLNFGALMAGVLLLAMGFVLLGLRSDMRRLAAISSAANAIGNGHFDVWLPPPTGDEVGRLSLALGRMVSRLSSMLHQVEVGRSMAAVGELATYLSHEIRNPLSSIRLNLQMLRRDLQTGAAPDDAPQLVALCLTELQRLDDVVRTVLDVGRKVEVQTGASCYVHDVVVDTVQVMHSRLREQGIEVLTRFEAVDAAVAIDPAGLKGVLINLLLNSIDALAGSETRRITITSELNDLEQITPVLELRIMDTGPGVPAHLRERIFEPFFTTKSTGNGIGLATSLRQLQAAGGLLRCAPPSEWTGGAEFVLELPLAGSVVPMGGDRPTMVAAGT